MEQVATVKLFFSAFFMTLIPKPKVCSSLMMVSLSLVASSPFLVCSINMNFLSSILVCSFVFLLFNPFTLGVRLLLHFLVVPSPPVPYFIPHTLHFTAHTLQHFSIHTLQHHGHIGSNQINQNVEPKTFL